MDTPVTAGPCPHFEKGTPMLATLHTLSVPHPLQPTDRAIPGAAPVSEVDVTLGPVPPATNIRLQRVTRWPSALPRLLRAARGPKLAEAERPRPPRVEPVRSRRDRLRLRESASPLGDDRGAVTAEYAVVILAAVAFAGLLVAILRSDEVRTMLLQLVQNALGSAG